MSAGNDARKLLLIDDDEGFTLPLGRMLEREGYAVRCARDGAEGLRLAAEEAPDAVLLDFLMPVKYGVAVAEELRRMPGLAGVPIIAMTAFGQNVGGIYGLPRSTACSPIQACLE